MKLWMFIFLGVFACLVSTSKAGSVKFESSDGEWTDEIISIKGRGFLIVLYEFEAYKLTAHKPNVTLVRTTPVRFFYFGANGPEWKVPFAQSSGHAKPFLGSLSDKEVKKLNKLADEDYQYWLKK